MIAAIQNSFAKPVLEFKVNYHISKINRGVAEVIYSVNGELHLDNFLDDAEMVANLHDGMKEKFIEISINLAPGEVLSNDKFNLLINDYLSEMGYKNSLYAAIKHSDKKYSHVHILATRIDLEGNRIPDSFSFLKSQKLSRDLEKKYGLTVTQYNKFNNTPLNELKAREYYFNNAFQKGLKNYTTKKLLVDLLKDNDIFNDIDANKPRTNIEFEVILGSEKYNKIGLILEEKRHFKSLYKDELIKTLDKNFAKTDSISEFRKLLEKDNCYMRLRTVKGKSYFVYGIKDANFYLREKSLPLTYHYNNLKEKGYKLDDLQEDVQKNYIYNHAFMAVNKCNTFEDFQRELEKKNITVILHEKTKGISDICFFINNIDYAKTFKASDISKKLSYLAIHNYFKGEKNDVYKIATNDNIVSNMKNEMLYISPFLYDNFEEQSKAKVKRKRKDRGDDQEKSNELGGHEL